MTKNKESMVSGKECFNCGHIFFEEWGSQVLLDHDEFHRSQIAWIELQEKRKR